MPPAQGSGGGGNGQPPSLKERVAKVSDEMSRAVLRSPLWKSVFRHDYDDTPRNRLLMVLGNIWLHLHPAKLPRHAVRIRFTWCMGGISFLLFLVLTFTGVMAHSSFDPTLPRLCASGSGSGNWCG